MFLLRQELNISQMNFRLQIFNMMYVLTVCGNVTEMLNE
jgi:hypothetical protein